MELLGAFRCLGAGEPGGGGSSRSGLGAGGKLGSAGGSGGSVPGGDSAAVVSPLALVQKWQGGNGGDGGPGVVGSDQSGDCKVFHWGSILLGVDGNCGAGGGLPALGSLS